MSVIEGVAAIEVRIESPRELNESSNLAALHLAKIVHRSGSNVSMLKAHLIGHMVFKIWEARHAYWVFRGQNILSGWRPTY